LNVNSYSILTEKEMIVKAWATEANEMSDAEKQANDTPVLMFILVVGVRA